MQSFMGITGRGVAVLPLTAPVTEAAAMTGTALGALGTRKFLLNYI